MCVHSPEWLAGCVVDGIVVVLYFRRRELRVRITFGSQDFRNALDLLRDDNNTRTRRRSRRRETQREVGNAAHTGAARGRGQRPMMDTRAEIKRMAAVLV